MLKQRYWYQEEASDGTSGSTGGGTGAPPGSGTGQTVDYSALVANFKEALAPEYKNNPALADIKDLNSLAKSYVSAQQMIGADKIVIPRSDATPEEWGAVYDKLGRPSTVDGYDLGQVEFPEGFPRDEKAETFIKQLFHKAGVNSQQAQTLYKEFTAHQIEQFQGIMTERQTRAEAAINSLKKEWGGKYDAEVSVAKQAVAAFGGEALKQFFNETGLGDHPTLIKAFNNIGKALAEDKSFRDGSLNQGFAPGEDAAKAEIARLQVDGGFMKAYTNRDDPQHAAAKARMDNLWKTAYPGQLAPS